MYKTTVKACFFSAIMAATVLLPGYAKAEQITLTSFDGSVSVTADFAGFQGQHYVVVYKGHEMIVPARNMSCEGNDCLQFTNVSNVTLVQNDG